MPLFANPAVLLSFYDPYFQSGAFKPHPWQVGVHADFAARSWNKPKELLVVVTNGGGKSSYIMAPAAIWTAMSFERSRTVVTSASIAQLDLQTMRAAKALASHINQFHKAELWEIQHRFMEFKPTHSIIEARKSDEEGTQEGFHPLVPGGEFTILVDEGKSIPPEIYNGILKWTGATRRMDVTSAGDPAGTFYHNWCHGPQNKWHITADQCPNITQGDMDRIISEAGGPDAPLARQILRSEFASLAGSVVITLDDVERCIRLGKEGAIKHKPAERNHAGLDLSGGGDETVLSVWNGNKQIALEIVPFHKEDQIEDHLAYVLIPKWKLRMEDIWADAGGLGRPMLRNIAQKLRAKGSEHGEAFRMVFNQQAPLGLLKGNFRNRGTEMWYRFAALLQDGLLILMEDPKQTTQLSNRYFDQQTTSDKICLEPKPVARAKGHPSPDRADASVLAMCNYQREERKQELSKPRTKLSADELEAYVDEVNAGRFVTPLHVGSITLEHLVGTRDTKL